MSTNNHIVGKNEDFVLRHADVDARDEAERLANAPTDAVGFAIFDVKRKVREMDRAHFTALCRVYDALNRLAAVAQPIPK
jgi:hypothetical protein